MGIKNLHNPGASGPSVAAVQADIDTIALDVDKLLSTESTGISYYVNGDVSASGAGTTWATAFKTIDEAVTASEAARGSTMIRNRIYIQGKSTAYAALTALPNFCDIIGIGASPRGNGTGIARINGAGAADAISSAVATRGNKFYNLQLGYSGAYYGLDSAGMFRTEFHNVVTLNDGAAGAGGIRFTGNSGGIIFDNVHTLSDSGWSALGLYLNGAITFNSCRFNDCTFAGTTAGILIDTGVYDHNTTLQHSVIGDIGGGCAKGIDDNTTTGWMVIAEDNTIVATIPIERNVHTRNKHASRLYASKASAANLTSGTLFNYKGTVGIVSITGRVTTVHPAAVNTCKLSVVSDALAAYDICATKDLTGLDAGTLLSITGTAADALVATDAVGSIAPGQLGMVVATCTTSGTITVTFGDSGNQNGAITWEVLWIPLSQGASLY